MANQESGILKVLVPFGGAMLIFLGVIYNSIYYSSFGIAINNFLELPEILLLFLNKLIFLSVSTISSIVIATKLKETEQQRIHESTENDSEKVRRKNWVKSLWEENPFFLALVIPAVVLWISTRFFDQKISFLLEGVILSLAASLLIGKTFGQVIAILERRLGLQFSRSIETLFFSFLLCLPVVFLYAWLEIYQVKFEKTNTGISIQTVDGYLINDSNHYYIGNTRQYLFFYDQVAKETTVYPMSDIKRISFGKPPSSK